VLSDGSLGTTVHADFVAGHGLAFRPGWESDWRFNSANPFDRILGNLGIHYVDLCRQLFGPIAEASARERSVRGSGTADTASISLVHENGVTAHLMLSYCTPYMNTATLHWSDGRLVLDDGKVRRYGPRDHFDADGRFATPPSSLLVEFASSSAYYGDALKRSITAFIDRIAAGTDEPEERFLEALDTARWVLRLANSNKSDQENGASLPDRPIGNSVA
jgi:predicted dehydrogenase